MDNGEISGDFLRDGVARYLNCNDQFTTLHRAAADLLYNAPREWRVTWCVRRTPLAVSLHAAADRTAVTRRMHLARRPLSVSGATRVPLLCHLVQPATRNGQHAA